MGDILPLASTVLQPTYEDLKPNKVLSSLGYPGFAAYHEDLKPGREDEKRSRSCSLPTRI